MSGAIFEVLSNWPDIVTERKMDLADELYGGILREDYPGAYATLRRLKEPLSGVQASKCLFHALSRTPRLFGRVLEHCEPEEYAYEEELPCDDAKYMGVDATILTAAAAMNRPQHMELLLEKGWDVNSEAQASEQAMYNAHGHSSGRSSIYHGRWDRPGIGLLDWRIGGVTPLAAAILCESENAVKVLLRHEGLKKLESAGVCRAAVVALHGSTAQRACLRLALGLESSADDPEGMAREFLCEHAPNVAAIAELCTPEEWTLRLDAAPCSPEQRRGAVEALTKRNGEAGPDNEEKLFALLDRFPELEQEQEIRDRMLNMILIAMIAEQRQGTSDYSKQRLLERWKAACGNVRDLTEAESDLMDMLLEKTDARRLFAELGAGGTLRASAESAWLDENERRTDYDKDQFLAACLDCVSIYRTTEEGVSDLAEHLLHRGNVRLLRKAAERGALRGESKEELMALLSGMKRTGALRALVLTLPEEQIGVASARPQPEDAALWQQWKEMDLTQRAAFLQQMWEEPLCAAECRKRLRLMKEGKTIDDWFLALWGGTVDGVRIQDLPTAACCGRNPELLRVLLEDGALDPRARESVFWADGGDAVTGTMLCLAATTGRTEQARLLLDRGLDPNEGDVPEYSVLYGQDIAGRGSGTTEKPRVVTPLYMALSKGHSETVELLRERGGYAYPSYDGADAATN